MNDPAQLPKFHDVRCLATDEDAEAVFRSPLPLPPVGDLRLKSYAWSVALADRPSVSDGSVRLLIGHLIAAPREQPLSAAAIELQIEPAVARRLGMELIQRAADLDALTVETLKASLEAADTLAATADAIEAADVVGLRKSDAR